MKSTKFSVATCYNRKKQLNKEGKALIQIIVSLNSRRRYFSTGIYILPEQWNEKQKKIKNHPNAAARNNEIYNKIIEIEGYITAQINKGIPPNLEKISNFINQKNKTDFFQFMIEQIEKSPNTAGTIANYKSTLHNLQRFKKHIDFDEIDFKFIENLEIWLRCRNIDKNTIANYMKRIKFFIRKAIDLELIDYHKNPFLKYKIKEIPKQRPFLTPDELKEFEKIDITAEPQHVQTTKAMFLFSCYTGLRYVDIHELKESDFLTDNGEVTIYKKQQKTDIIVNLPISSINNGKPLQILSEYKTDKGYFNKISIIQLNKDLKTLIAKTTIKKHVTFHTARHTNATVLLNKGVSITSVQKLLGHKNIKTTMIYAETLNDTIKKEVERIIWN